MTEELYILQTVIRKQEGSNQFALKEEWEVCYFKDLQKLLDKQYKRIVEYIIDHNETKEEIKLKYSSEPKPRINGEN